MQSNNFSYQDGATQLEGYLAYPEKKTEKMPVVLIAPAWDGRNQFACDKAVYLAQLGYVGFALDMYGGGAQGSTTEEKTRLMTPFMQDRALTRQRVLAAFNAAKKLEGVDPNRIAIIGFCFGGLCALDLARSGAALKGVVTFHGLLRAPENLANEEIHAKILALHGYDDPMVSAAELSDFEHEMTQTKVDWQVHVFGNTKHAFTNPLAHDEALGTVYNELAAKRSWPLLENFLAEIFA